MEEIEFGVPDWKKCGICDGSCGLVYDSAGVVVVHVRGPSSDDGIATKPTLAQQAANMEVILSVPKMLDACIELAGQLLASNMTNAELAGNLATRETVIKSQRLVINAHQARLTTLETENKVLLQHIEHLEAALGNDLTQREITETLSQEEF